jgi:hypothetical protein
LTRRSLVIALPDRLDPGLAAAAPGTGGGPSRNKERFWGGAQGGITIDFPKEIYIPIVDEADQKEIASKWVVGMQKSNQYRKQYEDSVVSVKKEIDSIIEKAKPISDDQLKSIITSEREKIEETEEEEQ